MCITLQTPHMRYLFSKFPEVLLADATHGTNRDNYKLFSFMVHDAYGNGQHVQVCGIYSNCSLPHLTLLASLSSLKSWLSASHLTRLTDLSQLPSLRSLQR